MTSTNLLLGAFNLAKKNHLQKLLIGVTLFFTMQFVSADTLTLPPGIPAPSFVNNMVLIDQPGNANDSTGYGGVNHKYRVSATQITVQDWVEFLNDIENRLGLNAATWGFGPITNTHDDCTNPWCDSPYRKSGGSGSWTAIAFNIHGVNLTAAQAANLPIDWLSMNMAARYLNWLATGNPDQGAFAFSSTSGQPQGNWRISNFDATYPGPRLPLEDELYKAMYRNDTNNTYYNYPLGGNSLPVASSDTNTALHNSGAGGALIDMFGANSSTAMYAQVGQEMNNPWGVRDVGGNRHETTLNPNNYLETIIRGSSVFQGGSISLKTTRLTQDDNNSNGPFLARKRFLSVSYRVWSGVSAPSGLIRITKSVTGGTDSQQFTFNLDCAGSLYDVSNINLSNGQTWESDSIPANTSCTVNETTPTAPAGFTYGAVQYSPSQTVTVGDGTTVTVTATNPLQAACSINSFTVTPVCNNNATATTAADDYRTFSATLSGNAVSSTYNMSVNNAGTVTPVSGNYGTPTNFRLQNGSAGNGTVYTLTATDSVNSSCSQTATVSDPGNCSPTGTLRVTKTVTNKPGGFSSPDFTMQLSCSDTSFNQTFTLADGEEESITGIPTGTTCSVAESTPLPAAPIGYEYGTPTISPSGAQTIGNATTVTIAVTNPLNSVACPTITVTPNPLADGTVGVAYNATPSASADIGGPYTYTWSATGLPSGLNVSGATGVVSGTPSATGSANIIASTTVAGQTCQGSTPLTVNSAPTGSLSVTKSVTGQPSGFTSPDFSIQVDCSVDSFDQALTLADGEAQTINGIPTGATCTVSEPSLPTAPTGYSYGTPSVSPSGAQTIGNATTVAVTVTNPLSLQLGNLQISKQVTGEPSGFTSPNYTIVVDCSDNTFDQNIIITAGQSQTISDIPHGTTCTITEPSQPSPPAGYSYEAATITPPSVTIQGNQTASVVVINPLGGVCVINQPVVTTQCYDNGTQDSSDDTFGFSINTSGEFTATHYDIQGAINVLDVPYDIESGVYGNFLITDGNVSLDLADNDDAACLLNGVNITAPSPCSVAPACTTVTNTASVTAMNETDANPSNDNDSNTLRADCSLNPEVDLELTKTASQLELNSGDSLVYTLTLMNHGPDMATEVEVRDQLPAGVTYVSNTASQGSYNSVTGIWRVDSLPDQAQATLQITVTID